jgi:hypothetical protein
MHTQANAKPALVKVHPGRHEAFDRDHGNDSPGQLGGWDHDDGVALFDHRHGWGERADGHHHHPSPAHAPDPQEGLVAVIGGSATAAGETSAVTGFVENFAEDRGDYSIAMGEAIFQASAHSGTPGGARAAANTFLDVSGADFIFEHEIGQSKHGRYDAWASSELDYLSIDIHGWSPPQGPIVIDVHQPFDHHQPSGPEPSYGNFAQVLALAEAHGADTLSATFTNALTIENHFSFVNAVGIVAL